MTRSRSSSGIYTTVAVAGVIACLYLAREILIPLAFAITLSLVLSPAVGWLQRLHIRRFLAVLWVMLVLITVAGGVGYVIFNQLVQVVNELPGYRENIDHKINSLRTSNTGSLGRAAQSVQELGKEIAAAQQSPPSPSTQEPARRSNIPASPLPVQVIEPPVSGMDYLRDLTRPFLQPLG